jgi:threonine dehydrogenase-like Zn-dependent dehydrogenase
MIYTLQFPYRYLQQILYESRGIHYAQGERWARGLVRGSAEAVMEEGHLLRKVNACAVCRRDLHLVEGDLALEKKRVIPGHQIVGQVVGGATDGSQLGSRVGVWPENSNHGRESVGF